MVDPVSTYTDVAQRLNGGASASASSSTPDTNVEPASHRTVRDTLEIGPQGQKLINLARGAELAHELPDASDREAFDAALRKAQEDVQRITTLFGTVLKDLNALPSPGQDAAVATPDALAEADDSANARADLSNLVRRIEAGRLGGGDYADALHQASRDVRTMISQLSETIGAQFARDFRV